MVIDVKIIKNSIVIKCDPIIPSKFKYQFIEKLESLYTLKINGADYFKKIDKLKITELEKEAYLKFYIENNFNYSFEEFLELTTFPIGTLAVISKKNDGKVAFIDFEPDGDVNMIWIDIYNLKCKKNLLHMINESMIEL